MNETPEQWAERMLSAAFDDPTGASFAYAELAAVKRKADASDLWREEALYVGESLAGDDLGHAQYEIACTARINAGLQ